MKSHSFFLKDLYMQFFMKILYFLFPIMILSLSPSKASDFEIAIASQLVEQDYERVEVKNESGKIIFEAFKKNKKRELHYSSFTGRLVEEKFSYNDPSSKIEAEKNERIYLKAKGDLNKQIDTTNSYKKMGFSKVGLSETGKQSGEFKWYDNNKKVWNKFDKEKFATFKEDWSGSKEDYSGKKEDWSGSKEDWSGKKEDWSGSKEDYSGSKEDYSGKKEDWSGKK